MVLLTIDKRIVRTLYVLTYFLLFFSICTKLFCIPYISTKFHSLGIAEYCRLFGIIEMIAVTAFLFCKTIGLGLVMLSAYFGGAIATDLHSPEYLYQPVIVFSLVIATSVIRKPSLLSDIVQIEQIWKKWQGITWSSPTSLSRQERHLDSTLPHFLFVAARWAICRLSATCTPIFFSLFTWRATNRLIVLWCTTGRCRRCWQFYFSHFALL